MNPPPFFMPIHHKFSEITGIVLGGGQSRRMGRDKRLLLWDGEPFLDRVCRLMNNVFEEVLVVTAQEDYECSHLPVRLVTDKIPHKGSLGGLYTGLMEAKNTCSFVVACDMPFLNTECIARMCGRSTSDVLVVKLSTGIQPLHARYSKDCVTVIEQKIHEGDLKIQNLVTHPDLAIEILDESFFHEIDPYGRTFMNINTPADFEFARKISLDSSRPK
ncbi:MAG: molybdenum cofactor guanylyltransferase [Nitrospirales bacterium]|nr:MAG: molybdenum cofactor guanylyltransferase [Nitrospirales bacterium]